jgi:hypothetical protein
MLPGRLASAFRRSASTSPSRAARLALQGGRRRWNRCDDGMHAELRSIGALPREEDVAESGAGLWKALGRESTHVAWPTRPTDTSPTGRTARAIFWRMRASSGRMPAHSLHWASHEPYRATFTCATVPSRAAGSDNCACHHCPLGTPVPSTPTGPKWGDSRRVPRQPQRSSGWFVTL